MSISKALKSNQLPFWILALTFIVALILPVLVQDGMFMDGVLYASVSNNLAQGIGTMWFLKFSDLGFAGFATFHEHPPLIFWIQSIFFKLFGNGMFVERGYSFLTALIAAWLIHKNWKLINYKNEALAKLGWLAVIFWILIPVAFWSFQNNVQENTMSVFSLSAVYFALKALHLQQKIVLNLILCGFMIFAASFAKGVPGFFPLVVVFAYWLFFQSFSFLKMIGYSLIVALSCAAVYGLILLSPEARESLSIYVFERLLGRVDALPTVDSHFYIMIRLFMEVLPLIVICVVFLVIYKLKKIPHQLNRDTLKKVGFFIFIGVCGSLPIMLTLVQKTFYMGASLPFFGIAFALIAAPGIAHKWGNLDQQKKSYKLFLGITTSMLLVAIIVSVLQIGKVSRNKDTIHDLYQISAIVPDHSTIMVQKEINNDWDLQVYLVRYFNISIDAETEEPRAFYLGRKDVAFTADSAYAKVDLDTKKYDLYLRKTE